jgi:o-succinylbenzoate synthase
MKIDRLELIHVELPLVAPFVTSYGRHEEQRTVLVHAFAEGIDAWAETSPLEAPMYCAETTRTAMYIIEEFLAPVVLGKDVATVEQLQELMGQVRGNQFAKAGVEMAYWCLDAVAQGKPLHELLGGTVNPVVVGNSIGRAENVDALLAEVQESLDLGYNRIKLKIMPGWDIDIVRAVRQAHPDIILQVDANSCYSLEDGEHLKELDQFNLALIEQPLGYTDLVDHAKLQRRMKTPICLDESIKDPDDVRKAIQLESCRIINIKPPRVGGLANAKRIHDMCAEADIPCWMGGMLESSIGIRINIEVATLANFTLPNDIPSCSRLFTVDLMDPPAEMNSKGEFHWSTEAPYDGQVRTDLVEKYTIEKRVLTP